MIEVREYFNALECTKKNSKEKRNEGACVYVCASRCLRIILFYLGWKHRPFEALNAVLGAPPLSHPASASCSGIMTATVTTTTPSNASAATMAIIAMDVVDVVF